MMPSDSPHSETGFPLAIEKLVYGGDGIGRSPEGEVIFVPWSVPGDRLRVQKQPGSQKPARGQILEIHTPSPDRVKPQCSVFGGCGGCQWQQVAPATQRFWKRNIVEESLTRIGKIKGVGIEETLGSDDTQWHFRNRVQWDIRWNTDQNRHELGYSKASSHEIIEFETCWIIPPELSTLGNWLQDYVHQNPALASQITRVEVMQNADGDILLSVENQPSNAQDLALLVDALTQAFPRVIGVTVLSQKAARSQVLYGQVFLTETISGKTYRVSAGNFFQTNRRATEQILNVLGQWLPEQAESLLDLYTGVGLFALHFSQRARRISAVETSTSSIQDAQENAKQHHVSHIDWHAGAVEKILPSFKDDFEIAILDPPRAGCRPEVLQWLSQHVTQQILYVSCNPTTLARDLKLLTDAGWAIETVQPIDMFPQTYHVETLVHLRRT